VADMQTQKIALSLVVFAAVMFVPLYADETSDAEKAELAKRESFRSGFTAIVDDLNNSQFDSFIRAVNRRAMIEQIFGLRLIDQKVKKQFNDRLEYTYDDMIKSGFTVPEEGLKATLLGLESRGDLGRAVVRYDYPDFQFGYHEFDLRLDKKSRVVVVDWSTIASCSSSASF
jgi:hypothetical protein